MLRRFLKRPLVAGWRSLGWLLIPLLTLAALLVARPADASSIFARQTGFSCNTCHFQHFPKLNAFGRRFKATGYSTTTQELIEGENLSLTPTLNAALKLGVQYADDQPNMQVVSQDPPGRIEFPPDHGAAILLGGRLAEGIGGFAEYDGALGTAKLALTRALPWEIGTLGLSPFMSDKSGAATGFELLNTGVYSMNKPFVRAASPITGDNPNLNTSTKAVGTSLYLANDLWNVAYTPFAATDPGKPTGLNLSQYARAAVTPNLFGWDMGLGGGYFWGATNVAGEASPSATPAMSSMYRVLNAADAPAVSEAGASGPATLNTRGWFVDAQAQGQLLGRDLGLYALYGVGDEMGANNLFGGLETLPSGWGMSAEYSVLPQLGLLATYGQYDRGDERDGRYQKTGVGLSYAIQQNLLLQPMYEVFSGEARPLDNRFTTLLSFIF